MEARLHTGAPFLEARTRSIHHCASHFSVVFFFSVVLFYFFVVSGISTLYDLDDSFRIYTIL